MLASDGLDRAVENRDEAVARGFDKLAVVLFDAGLDEVALDPLDAGVRPLFVDLHQAAVAGDIAGYDRSKAPRRWLARWLTGSARLDVTNLGHDVDWLPNCEHSVRQAIFPAPVAYHTDYGRQTTVPGFHAG